MTRIIVLAALGIALAGSARADDAEAIATAARAFSAAYCAGDTTALSAIYTEDAVIIPPGRELFGRAAIARYFAPRSNRENVSHRTECASLEMSHDMWHRPAPTP